MHCLHSFASAFVQNRKGLSTSRQSPHTLSTCTTAQASQAPGWLQAINASNAAERAGQQAAAKSESEEYGVTSFVYTARKPFHPGRLYRSFMRKFFLTQASSQQSIPMHAFLLLCCCVLSVMCHKNCVLCAVSQNVLVEVSAAANAEQLCDM